LKLFGLRNLGLESKTRNGFVGFGWKRDGLGLNRVKEVQSLRKIIEYRFFFVQDVGFGYVAVRRTLFKVFDLIKRGILKVGIRKSRRNLQVFRYVG